MDLDTIRRVFPDRQLNAVTQTAAGQNNTVLIVDDRYVFRFPLYEAGRRQLQFETRVLQVLQGKVPLAVPNPTYVRLDAPIGQAFMGYRTIQGQSTNIYTLESRYPENVCDRLAQQLGGFLNTLHGIALNAFGTDLPEAEGIAYWADMYERIRDRLFERMRIETRDEVSQHFEDYLNAPDDFDPCLIHGDFGTGNILFDPDKATFTGVIDFGGAAIGDPAVDLAAIYGFQGRGDDFARRVAQHYPAMESMMRRIRFYSGTFALQEALFGIENGDEAALQAGLAEYV